MPKNSWNDYSTTAASNTDVHSVSIAEGMAPSDVNNAMRELMVDVANFDQGNVTLTSALAVASGGTGAATHTANNVLVGAGTGAVTSVAPSTSGNVLTSNGTVWQSTAASAAPGKNLIFNGDFAVAQRGTSYADVGGGAWAYKVFDGVIQTGLTGTETGRYTLSQSTTVPPNTGHRQSMKIDITTADTSIASDHWYYLQWPIEAQNCSHLQYGESGAKSLTASFWVRSTTTGDYQFMLKQQDASRQYSTGYTIDSANTWQKITLTIPGDTDASAAINNDTGAGLHVYMMLTAGSSGVGGTEDAWTAQANNQYGAGMSLNLFSSTSNDWYMAGFQLEVGTSATDFEFEDYGTTLRKCRRYYWEFLTATDAGIATCKNYSTTIAHGTIWHPGMRATPTLTVSDATDFKVNIHGSSVHCTGMAIQWNTEDLSTIAATVASGLTAGYAGTIMFDGSGTRSFALSAELS